MSSSMARAARSAADAASSISATIANIPDATVYVNVARGSVSLPHFSMSGTFDAKKGTVPTVSVDRYAKGAIFEPNRPGIIGIGDARVPEVAAPLDALRDMLGIDGRDDDAPRVAVNLNYRAGEDANRLARDTARALDRIQRTRR